MADLIAPMPSLELAGGAQLVFEARDPSSGAAVGGVTVSDIAIYGSNVGPTGEFGDVLPVLSNIPNA